MKIPLLDLKKQYKDLKPEVMKAIENVVDSGHFILGPDIEKFEKEVASYLGVKYALGVTSGTDALFMALKGLGVGHGDKVLTTPFTFFATASAICNSGAEPVFADILDENFNIDPASVEEVLKNDTEKKIKVILPVHLYGQAADMQALVTIAKKYNVQIVEDAAQAIGTKYQGKQVGGFGAYGCFSLFPTKNLGAMGDAGILTTNDEALYQKAKLIRVHGGSKQYHHDLIGSNFRIDTMQATILRVLLPHLNSWISNRSKLAERYNQAFETIRSLVEAPNVSANANHAYHQYTIRVKNGLRDSLKDFLTTKDIACCIYYPIPAHLQKALAHLGHKQGDFPVTEKACAEVLSLPVYPVMTMQEQDYVIDSIQEWARLHTSIPKHAAQERDLRPVQ